MSFIQLHRAPSRPRLQARRASSSVRAVTERTRRVLATAGVALVALLLGLALRPAFVNGDGLGFLKAAPSGDIVPGHLGYLPLLRAAGALAGRTTSLAMLGPARAVSLVSLVIAALALLGAARRVLDESGALIAAVGLAVSYGALEAGADVESYAPALAMMCVTTWCAMRRRDGGHALWLVATALGVAGAALLHIENVLFAPAAALLAASRADRRPRIADVLAVLFGSGAPVLVAYALAAHAQGQAGSLTSALHWVTGASHGFSYPLRWSTPAVAVYGMAKTLVYAPYPHQASWARVIGEAAAGVCALATMLWLARRPERRAPLGLLVGAAWVLPYAIVGVAFFASDNERWLFLLPPAWLVAGAGAQSSPRARSVAIGLVATLLACDLGLGVPLARDRTLGDRAASLAGHLAPNDLVISPGHSWDEYLGFYDDKSLDRFPMIYFCGQLGSGEAMRKELDHRVTDARARGSRIWFLRADEPVTSDGWKELVRFGIDPVTFRNYLPKSDLVPEARGMQRLVP